MTNDRNGSCPVLPMSGLGDLNRASTLPEARVLRMRQQVELGQPLEGLARMDAAVVVRFLQNDDQSSDDEISQSTLRMEAPRSRGTRALWSPPSFSVVVIVITDVH